jgi:hypothetical protein
MSTVTTKIVIVAGQEFSVPAETDNDQIRQHLAANGYPDVANADIKLGKRTIDGVEHQTVEFAKKAGTKGSSEGGELDLAALLAQIRAVRNPFFEIFNTPVAVRHLLLGRLTIEQAMALDLPRLCSVSTDGFDDYDIQRKGELLCDNLESLPAVPAAAPVVGW